MVNVINATNLKLRPHEAGAQYVEIKCPSKLSYERYKITKGGRVTSGLMCIDVIDRKKKFKIVYEVLSGTDLDTLVEILDSMYPYYDMSWHESGIQYECVVYPGAITYDRFRTDGIWYYKNVNFDLIER